MSLETMTKLFSTTVGVTSVSSITFSNIPQGYTDLKVCFSARNDAGTGTYNEVWLTLNGSSTGYSGKNSYTIGTTVGSLNSASTYYLVGASVTTGNSGNAWGNGEAFIHDYSGNTLKSISSNSVTETSSTTNGTIYSAIGCGLWSNPAPVTSLTLTSGGGLFVQNTTATLYGIKNALKTFGPAKAVGGNTVVFDGTYWYHTFTSTGIFSPLSNISCDYLVVAGGGGGGRGANEGYGGGGGGAGGVRFSTSLLTFTTNYTVTVGAGGLPGIGNYMGTQASTNGSNSSIIGTNLSYSATGGGFGATVFGNGGNGGSGGGAGGHYGGTGGTGGSGNAGGYTPVEGYAGGNGQSGGQAGAGGGGGAGGVGAAATVSTGGIGTNAYSLWAAATSTGVSGYYGGGGGGGGSAGTGAGGAGGGGAGLAGAGTATAGTANTGGGGGGNGNGTAGGAGGSGIVIIRYKG